jgi:chromosome segregation ATPase
MEASERFARLGNKIQMLIRQHESLQKTNDKLKSELKSAQEKIQLYQEEIAGLQQRVLVLKTSSGQLNDNDKKDLEKRLNHYLKEIDRCITMMGN